MIYFYSGTPGSGKSLHVARDILIKTRLKRQNVITNMNINYEYIYTSGIKKTINKILSFFRIHKQLSTKRKKHGIIYQVENEKITPELFYQYALKFHKRGKEGQTLIVLDEAQMIFSPSQVKLKCQENARYRVEWLDFFTQHRHLGYNIIMVSQFDMLIDPQIRYLFEYDVKHKKANNYKIGWLFTLFRMQLFVGSCYWYGMRLHNYSEFFVFQKKYATIYDSYKKFDDMKRILEEKFRKKKEARERLTYIENMKKKHA